MMRTFLLLCLLLYTVHRTDAADADGNLAFIDSLLCGDACCDPDGCEVKDEVKVTTRCERDRFVCTEYFRCEEQHIVSDQLGVFDIRIGFSQFQQEHKALTHSECPRYGDVCCVQPLPEGTNPSPEPFAPRCGRRNEAGIGASIVGFNDSEAQFGEYPWAAAVLRVEKQPSGEDNTFFVCGGALIHEQVVLTAAHCVHELLGARLEVRLGEWDPLHELEVLPHVDVAVSGVVIHPEFVRKRLQEDVALLFLAEPVTLQPHIDTLCLPDPNVNYDHTQCMATTWGRELFGNFNLFKTVLKSTFLPHVPRDDCQTALRRTNLNKYFRMDQSFTCAGPPGGHSDTCVGDGGSPLACRDPTNHDVWVQMGVVSWGRGCGDREGVSGVYADVRRQVEWINRWIRNLESQQQPQQGEDNGVVNTGTSFGQTSATSEQQTTGDGVQTNQGTATAVSVQQQTGLGGATQTTNNQGAIQALQQAQGGSGGGGQSSDNQVIINSSQQQQNVDGTLVNVQASNEGIVIINTFDPSGKVVGSQVINNKPPAESDQESSNCVYWCLRPFTEIEYCCDDGTNQRGSPGPQIHGGLCPPLRVLGDRRSERPRICAGDFQCAASDKCCYDGVVQHHVCKTAQPRM